MIESALVMFGGTMYLTGIMRRHLNKKEKQKKLYKLANAYAKNKKTQQQLMIELQEIINE